MRDISAKIAENRQFLKKNGIFKKKGKIFDIWEIMRDRGQNSEKYAISEEKRDFWKMH